MKTGEELFQRLLGKGLHHVYFYEEGTVRVKKGEKMTCERCEFLHNCRRQCMYIPQGKHCSDCVNVEKCVTMFGAKRENTSCGFEPVRFVEKKGMSTT